MDWNAVAMYIIGVSQNQTSNRVVDPAIEFLKSRVSAASRAFVETVQRRQERQMLLVARRLCAAHEAGYLPEDDLSCALEEPSVRSFLIDAGNAAAMTDEESKYNLIAELVVSRMLATNETSYAMSLQLAMNTLTLINQSQIKILALLVVLGGLLPEVTDLDEVTEAGYVRWLAKHIAPYRELKGKIHDYDTEHLAAAGCLFVALGVEDFYRRLKIPPKILIHTNRGFTPQNFITESEPFIFAHEELWPHIGGYFTTTHGRIIGAHAHASVTGIPITWEDWDAPTSTNGQNASGAAPD
jgi:hypothetical protein